MSENQTPSQPDVEAHGSRYSGHTDTPDVEAHSLRVGGSHSDEQPVDAEDKTDDTPDVEGHTSKCG